MTHPLSAGDPGRPWGCRFVLLLFLCGTPFHEVPPLAGNGRRAGGWAVTGGGWRVTDGGWRVTDGGWRVTDGGWRVTDGGWRVNDGG